MARSSHQGEYAVNCPLCITKAERTRAPWQNSYIDVFSSGAGESIEKAHKQAMKQRGKADWSRESMA